MNISKVCLRLPATPVILTLTGETVVGGGTNDVENILPEVQRFIDSVHFSITDTLERV